jgi:hypothetical protein
MSDEKKRPTPGEMYYTDEDEDTEIAEILAEDEDGSFKVADEDGEEAQIRWSTANERWEVDA